MSLLKICIQDRNDAHLLARTIRSIEAISHGGITYVVYLPQRAHVELLWQEAADFLGEYFLLFVQAGDEVCISPEMVESLDSSIDLYYLTPEPPTGQYPRIHLDPLRFSTFWQGKQRIAYFLINTRCATKHPLIQANGDWTLLGTVLRTLLDRDIYYVTLYGRTVTALSPSITNVPDFDYMLGTLMPNDFSPFQQESIAFSRLKVESKYIRHLKRRCSSLSSFRWIASFLQPGSMGYFPSKYRFRFFTSKYKDNWNNIPIIINNYNRHTYLRRLIDSLVKRGVTNIYIIDNNSTYPPLLEYYKTLPYKIYFLGRNVGYRALWETEVFDDFKDDLYVYTDPDLEIDEACPADFMSRFVSLHRTYPKVWKVGFSLRIDDLPAHFKLRNWVSKWECQFSSLEVEKELFYAAIDTTFALYKPYYIGAIGRALRVGGDYYMRHLPWYVDSENLSQEEKYYLSACTRSTHWSQNS